MAELLAPAGNIESLDAAIGEGADAVYLGLKSFNARLRTANFAWNQFEAAVGAVHRLGKKIYVALNTVIEERETERVYRLLSYLDKIRPDGLIVQDLGIIRMCQEFFPELELHASTQMNVESAAAANLLLRDGVKRVVLARELGLEEIRSVRAGTKAELELFVHGALCVSESGLCLFSSFLGGKSANRGMCTQACRRYFTAECAEGARQGYYFSPCDMQLIDRIPELMEIGVDSFKIEGRMKSAEYVGSVVAAYRYVIDHWQEDRKGAIATGKRLLSSDFARSKTEYWYGFKDVKDGVEAAGEKILNPDQSGGTGIFLGTVAATKQAPDGLKEELAKNAAPDAPPPRVKLARLSGGSYEPDPGDSIRLHRKDDSLRESHKIRSVEVDEDGGRWIDVPSKFGQGDSVYLLQIKSLSKRRQRILPSDLNRFRRQPGDERLPTLDLTPVKNKELSYFPEGVYVQVSSVSDIFLAQAFNPVRLIVEFNSETKRALLESSVTLPFSKKMVFISLDPYCPAGAEQALSEELARLVGGGFVHFVVNNIAHLEMLRGKGVRLTAGPYLYTFNRWAASWLENQDVTSFIMPYENSRRNLEESFDADIRQRVLVPVFAYPALFRIRFKLPKSYDFTYFTDKEGEGFKLLSSEDGSCVMPELPFSLLDKGDLLAQAGFRRMLIDFSRTKLTKAQVKAVQGSLFKKQALPDVSRFNWKEGFYSPQLMEGRKAGALHAQESHPDSSRAPAFGRGAHGRASAEAEPGSRPKGAGGRPKDGGRSGRSRAGAKPRRRK
ncbi:MAG: U32 family peptidase [Treponemataceae bacterium]|nr:U32 family peptidase [Treponemataceae bacterium]